MATGPTQEPTMFSYMTSSANFTRPEPEKNKPGRKPGSGKATAQKKKTPQRGMGVEQLEKLRIQERWNKMTEMSPAVDPLHRQTGHCNQYPLLSPDPIPSVPVLHGAANYGVPVNPGGGWLGFDPGVYRMGGNGGGGFGGWGNPVWMGPNRVEIESGLSSGGFMSFIGNSKELSSIPNILHQNQWPASPDHCGVCIKKMKRFDDGDDHTNTQREGVKVLAVHRSSSGGGGGGKDSGGRSCNVVMEYEFMPEKGDKYRSASSMEFAAEEAVGSYDSTITATTYGPSSSSSSSLDLSLRL